MKKDQYTLDFLSNPQHLYLGEANRFMPKKPKPLELMDFALYHIEELTFEDQAPRKEAFENVISSLRIEGVSFLYLILGNKRGVSFYFGVVRDLMDTCELSLSIHDIGEQILAPSLKGNFRGSKINEVSAVDKQFLHESVRSMSCYGFMEGVPGISEDNEDFQGVDRLIDVMQGDEFGLAIISKPLKQEDIFNIEKNLYMTFSGVAPFVKQSIQEGDSKGVNQSKTVTVTQSDTVGESTSIAHTNGESTNSGKTEGANKSIATGKSTSTQNGSSSNSSSETTTGTEGSNTATTQGKATSSSKSDTTGTSKSTTTGNSIADSNSVSDSHSNSITFEFLNKEAQDWIKYLDEVLFPRLDYGKSRGMFVSTAFLFTNNDGNLIKLANTMQSLYSGQSGNKVPLRLHSLHQGPCLDSLKSFQIPQGAIVNISNNEAYARNALSQIVQNDRAYIGNWMSTNELSLMAGLPQKEVVGLSLKEEVEFGLNFPTKVEEPIELGSLIQSGRVLDNIDVVLDKGNLNKHIFVTGVTGSGKTTTCQKLLIDSGWPFLVIEPAKTEYRILTEQFNDLLIYTLGKNTVAPFRLNPFEFFPHESITSRVDLIKASLEASFDMEAAIPQILESAIYECYKDYGWNIATNTNNLYLEPFADGVYAFPTFGNLVEKVETVVKLQGFDDRLKNDYIGSIKARLQGLMVGSKGLMLNTKRSIDFEQILDQKVILELEEIKSGSEKSLIMGFILMNLVEALKGRYIKGEKLKHITLIEEAHRLLSKYAPGDSLNKKQGVEVFADMLAEVRKYGESLIIVDQIPSKLTSEVLKNTNTKIVHKLFAKDDKEAIGNTMALTEEQQDFLSYLEVGRAIVFTQGWNKALQIQIAQVTDTTGERIVTDTEIRLKILEAYRRSYKRGVLLGLELFEEKPSIALIEKYLEFIQGHPFTTAYYDLVETTKSTFEFKDNIQDLFENYCLSLDLLSYYLAKTFYSETVECSLLERQSLIKELLEVLLTGKNPNQLASLTNMLKIKKT